MTSHQLQTTALGTRTRCVRPFVSLPNCGSRDRAGRSAVSRGVTTSSVPCGTRPAPVGTAWYRGWRRLVEFREACERLRINYAAVPIPFGEPHPAPFEDDCAQANEADDGHRD